MWNVCVSLWWISIPKCVVGLQGFPRHTHARNSLKHAMTESYKQLLLHKNEPTQQQQQSAQAHKIRVIKRFRKFYNVFRLFQSMKSIYSTG